MQSAPCYRSKEAPLHSQHRQQADPSVRDSGPRSRKVLSQSTAALEAPLRPAAAAKQAPGVGDDQCAKLAVG